MLSSALQITGIDVEGKKFDKVSRLVATGDKGTCVMDYNDEIFPLSQHEKIRLTIMQGHDATKMTFEPYEYVMSGTYYKAMEEEGILKSFVSCGGLLLCVEGQLSAELGSEIYVCVQKMK